MHWWQAKLMWWNWDCYIFTVLSFNWDGLFAFMRYCTTDHIVLTFIDVSFPVEMKKDSDVNKTLWISLLISMNQNATYFYWFLILKVLWHLFVYLLLSVWWKSHWLTISDANEGKLHTENRQFGHCCPACNVAAMLRSKPEKLHHSSCSLFPSSNVATALQLGLQPVQICLFIKLQSHTLGR